MFGHITYLYFFWFLKSCSDFEDYTFKKTIFHFKNSLEEVVGLLFMGSLTLISFHKPTNIAIDMFRKLVLVFHEHKFEKYVNMQRLLIPFHIICFYISLILNSS
jgi:hypothetical protein